MTVAMGRITWHEGAPDPHLPYAIEKSFGPYRVFSFGVRTLPWEMGSGAETRYFLAMTETPASLSAYDMVRFSESTANRKAALLLFEALVAGVLI